MVCLGVLGLSCQTEQERIAALPLHQTLAYHGEPMVQERLLEGLRSFDASRRLESIQTLMNLTGGDALGYVSGGRPKKTPRPSPPGSSTWQRWMWWRMGLEIPAGPLPKLVPSQGWWEAACVVSLGFLAPAESAMLRQHTVEQLARVGGHSVGIVVLVVFVVGAVISMQIGPLLRDYGVVIMIADVAGIGFLRELGPMLTAVVLWDTPARPSPRSWAP